MKLDLLLKDPVFQLNILLWMAKEQDAENYYVYPLFHQLGFRIVYVETPFAFPEVTMRAILDSGLDICIEPEPDVVLGRESDNKALYFEAKANSFTPGSTNSKQARAHLVASGPVFEEVWSPYSACQLCYVLPKSRCGPMSRCLTALAGKLRENGLRPGPFSCHGLAVKGTRMLCLDPRRMRESSLSATAPIQLYAAGWKHANPHGGC
jgi:hypothetical protein